jgi:hypothetical protein
LIAVPKSAQDSAQGSAQVLAALRVAVVSLFRAGGCRMADLVDEHAWPDFRLDSLGTATEPLTKSN